MVKLIKKQSDIHVVSMINVSYKEVVSVSKLIRMIETLEDFLLNDDV